MSNQKKRNGRTSLPSFFPILSFLVLIVLPFSFPPLVFAQPTVSGNVDNQVVKVGLLRDKPIITTRVQSINGEWLIKFYPMPAPGVSREPLFSSEVIEVLSLGEDATFQLTPHGIVSRLSSGKELPVVPSPEEVDVSSPPVRMGFSRIEIYGGETISFEVPGKSPVVLTGVLTLSAGEKFLEFTNTVSLHEYLITATSDLTPGPEPEAIKANLVMVRSFALASKRAGRHASESFDLCDTSHCLVFPGSGQNRDLVRFTLDKSTPEILVHKGEIVLPHFTHTCGGKTSSAKDVFFVDDPVHRGIEDRLEKKGSENCYHSPSFQWRRTFTQEEISDMVSASFAGGAQRIFLKWEPKKTDPTGRITEISVRGRLERSVPGTEFLTKAQEYFGPNSLKSMRFTVQPMRQISIYSGWGQGFGVGLCLMGADGLAKKGLDYRKILNFYFSEIEIRRP